MHEACEPLCTRTFPFPYPLDLDNMGLWKPEMTSKLSWKSAVAGLSVTAVRRFPKEQKQCKSPTVTGKTKGRFDGGKSTGPRTPEGKQRVIDANTDHGLQTKALSELYRKENVVLARLEQQLIELGMISVRTPGA
jgi:hypothetical protein